MVNAHAQGDSAVTNVRMNVGGGKGGCWEITGCSVRKTWQGSHRPCYPSRSTCVQNGCRFINIARISIIFGWEEPHRADTAKHRLRSGSAQTMFSSIGEFWPMKWLGRGVTSSATNSRTPQCVARPESRLCTLKSMGYAMLSRVSLSNADVGSMSFPPKST